MIRTKPGKFAAIPLMTVLLFSTVSSAYAAPAAESPTASALPNEVSAASYAIPTDRTESEIDGERIISETFDVPASIDPNILIKDNFVGSHRKDNGEMEYFLYSEDSIVKTPYTNTVQKEVTQSYSQAAKSSSLKDNLSKLPASIAYEEEGWEGTLYLDPTSVNIQTTNRSSKSKNNSATKTYNVEFNDPSQIPATYNGMPRVSLTWKEAGYIDGTSIPSGYIATATYASTSYYSVASAWAISGTYIGTATQTDVGNIRYTIIYKGIEIPEGYSVIDGQLTPPAPTPTPTPEPVSEKPDTSPLILKLWIFVVIAIAAGIILFLLGSIKKGLLYSRKIIVQAQDDISGEYKTIQKVAINKNSPAFTIDTLRVPSAQHFLCSMSPSLALSLKGKIINISADGNLVSRHRVEPLNETDRYTFAVDLEQIDAGPLDNSVL